MVDGAESGPEAKKDGKVRLSALSHISGNGGYPSTVWRPGDAEAAHPDGQSHPDAAGAMGEIGEPEKIVEPEKDALMMEPALKY